MPTERVDIFTLARFGDLETFKNTLNLCDINRKSEGGASLLHYAISGNNFGFAKQVGDEKLINILRKWFEEIQVIRTGGCPNKFS